MSRIPEVLRLLVAHRAAFRCEYCRIPDFNFALPFQVDHIRPLKHNGPTVFSNLAYCCPDCNRYKGTDLGSFEGSEALFIPFFNPRTDIWDEHFNVVTGLIIGQTSVGNITAQIFKFNRDERVIYRLALIEAALY